jgi:hypothetical protein
MGLREMMANHLERVILRTDHFAEEGEYAPGGGATSFHATIAMGDVGDQVVDLTTGNGQQQQQNGTASLTALRAGILALLGEERDPLLGDTFTIATGALKGVWMVSQVVPDQGDAVVLTLRYDRRLTAGGGGR